MADAPSFGPRDLLREARRRLPELEEELETCLGVPASVLADAVAHETCAWAQQADEADQDVVFRILDFWSDVLDRADVDREVANALAAALSLLRVEDQPYGSEALRRATPRMRQLMAQRPWRWGAGR